MAGFPNVRYTFRGQKYTCDFKKMVQFNGDTRKTRQIRAPPKWRPPTKPLCTAGPATVITVPTGSPGTKIYMPHPRSEGQYITVQVPDGARPGQAMLVPLPRKATQQSHPTCSDGCPAITSSGTGSKASVPETRNSGAWTTSGKIAAGGLGAVAIGAAYVGGIVLGDHIYDHGLDATLDDLGDGLEDAGEEIADFAVDAGDFFVDAAEDVGDFVMDLF